MECSHQCQSSCLNRDDGVCIPVIQAVQETEGGEQSWGQFDDILSQNFAKNCCQKICKKKKK